MYPTIDNIILVSNAVIQMFDKLRDDQGGIVSKISNQCISISDRRSLITYDFFQKNLISIDGTTGKKLGCLYNSNGLSSL